jgi:hypothetical protein
MKHPHKFRRQRRDAATISPPQRAGFGVGEERG